MATLIKPSKAEIAKSKLIAAIAAKRKSNLELIALQTTGNRTAKIPETGMGATLGVGSDSYPHTIVEVSETLDYIIVTQDEAIPTADYDYYANQSHRFIIQPDAQRVKFTLRKTGEYIQEGSAVKCRPIWVGNRRKYQDPSF